MSWTIRAEFVAPQDQTNKIWLFNLWEACNGKTTYLWDTSFYHWWLLDNAKVKRRISEIRRFTIAGFQRPDFSPVKERRYLARLSSPHSYSQQFFSFWAKIPSDRHWCFSDNNVLQTMMTLWYDKMSYHIHDSNGIIKWFCNMPIKILRP